jgi:hypothetical protein
VSSVLAVVDCCRPQRTKIVDPDSRFPGQEFLRRTDRIRAIADSMLREGHFDEVVYLLPGNELFPHLAQKYLRNVVRETHDYAGCALMSYLAGIELTRTQFVLHYDADMLLYQAPGYDWAQEAIALMTGEDSIVAATPRICPPRDDAAETAQSLGLGGLTLEPTNGGWRDPWFSTRCFLLDRTKLDAFLPLMKGRLLLETLVVKYLRRGYPRSPEIMLHRRIGGGGGSRLQLATKRAWLLHPLSKPPKYLELLPAIHEAVLGGEHPAEQAGNPEIDIPAWDRFLRLEPRHLSSGDAAAIA